MLEIYGTRKELTGELFFTFLTGSFWKRERLNCCRRGCWKTYAPASGATFDPSGASCGKKAAPIACFTGGRTLHKGGGDKGEFSKLARGRDP